MATLDEAGPDVLAGGEGTPQDTATRTWRESAEQAAASLGTQGPQPPGALKGRGRGLLQGVHRTPWIQTPASGTRGTDFCGTLL